MPCCVIVKCDVYDDDRHDVDDCGEVEHLMDPCYNDKNPSNMKTSNILSLTRTIGKIRVSHNLSIKTHKVMKNMR